MNCAASFRLAEKGLAAIIMSAVSINSPLPIYETFNLFFIKTSKYYYLTRQKTIGSPPSKNNIPFVFWMIAFSPVHFLFSSQNKKSLTEHMLCQGRI